MYFSRASASFNLELSLYNLNHLPINPPFPGVRSPKLSLVHPYLLPVPITLDRVDNMGKHQDTTQRKTSTRVDDGSHHNRVASSREITGLEATNLNVVSLMSLRTVTAVVEI
ncbi:MAG: hypothetical protein QOE37_2185 [Microbacteriaceae bacterium]|jgi:hypothetical protein|nr:hypothetical protein [Microbacteriaceae bacterium]